MIQPLKYLILLLLCLGQLSASLNYYPYLETHEQTPLPALLALLKEFDITHDGSWASIVHETQKKWQRKTGSERWDLQEYPIISEEQYLLFKNIGMIEVSHPEKNDYEYAVILGATLEKVRSRFHFLHQEWLKGVRFNKLVILTGDRLLNPDFENREAFLKCPYPVRSDWQKPDQWPTNETAMCLFVYDQLDLPNELRKREVIVIDAPQKNGLRPNTKDTIECWLKMNPKPGNLFMVSDQPFLARVHILAHKMLPLFAIETIGQGLSFEKCAQEKRAVSVLLDELSRIIYTLKMPLQKQ